MQAAHAEILRAVAAAAAITLIASLVVTVITGGAGSSAAALGVGPSLLLLLTIVARPTFNLFEPISFLLLAVNHAAHALHRRR
jgi:hypothetical protein